MLTISERACYHQNLLLFSNHQHHLFDPNLCRQDLLITCCHLPDSVKIRANLSSFQIRLHFQGFPLPTSLSFIVVFSTPHSWLHIILLAILATCQNSLVDRSLAELTSWLLPRLPNMMTFIVTLAPWMSKQWQESTRVGKQCPCYPTSTTTSVPDLAARTQANSQLIPDSLSAQYLYLEMKAPIAQQPHAMEFVVPHLGRVPWWGASKARKLSKLCQAPRIPFLRGYKTPTLSYCQNLLLHPSRTLFAFVGSP